MIFGYFQLADEEQVDLARAATPILVRPGVEPEDPIMGGRIHGRDRLESRVLAAKDVLELFR